MVHNRRGRRDVRAAELHDMKGENAQAGMRARFGTRGRWFESTHPDSEFARLADRARSRCARVWRSLRGADPNLTPIDLSWRLAATGAWAGPAADDGSDAGWRSAQPRSLLR